MPTDTTRDALFIRTFGGDLFLRAVPVLPPTALVAGDRRTRCSLCNAAGHHAISTHVADGGCRRRLRRRRPMALLVVQHEAVAGWKLAVARRFAVRRPADLQERQRQAAAARTMVACSIGFQRSVGCQPAGRCALNAVNSVPCCRVLYRRYSLPRRFGFRAAAQSFGQARCCSTSAPPCIVMTP